MERITFRDLVTEIIAVRFGGRPDCRVQYENGPSVDMGNVTVPVIGYEIVYSNSEQADMAEAPFLLDEGDILITVLVKEMTGNKTAYALRDEIAELLQRRHLAGAVTQVARLLPNSHLVKGWVGYRVSVPFRHYHN